MPKVVFTEANRDKILESIAQGNYLQVAAAQAGVPYRTVMNWMKKGKEDTSSSSKHREFYDNVKKAEADFEAQAVSQIVGSGSPKYLLEVLSRKNPNSWSSTSRVIVQQVEEKISNFMDYLTEELAEEPEILRKVMKIAEAYTDEEDI